MAVTPRPVHVGLLGCGRIARIFHLPILADLAGVELVAVAEPDPVGRARAVAAAPRATVVADWRDVVADPGIDALVVCLPSGMHAEAAGAAFEAGRHVYLEKPIATSLDDGRRVLAAWRSSGKVGMAGFDQRFEPAIDALRREVLAGRVGAPTGARLAMGSGRRDAPEWKRARATGGGVLLDLGSHMADLTRFVLGEEVREVCASLATTLADEDTASFTMTLASGKLAQAWVTLAGITESRVEVVGERGLLTADRYAGTVRFFPLEPAWSRVDRAREGLARLGRDSRALIEIAQPLAIGATYRAALEAFAAAVAAGRQTSPDIGDGFRSLAVVLAAEASARTGLAVAPAEP
jgi:myo-inositol 2-dehydrogenase/D-chiro-inositol 1-dehydrogenase